jgi:hypothetical protein
MKRLFAGMVAALAVSSPAAAQSVGGCDAPAASARNIYAPFSETVREFEGGAIRITALDEGPDARGSGLFNRGAYHLMVTYRLADGSGSACVLISARGREGFFGLRMGQITARDRAGGATLINLPVDEILGGDMIFPRELFLTVDRAQGTVQASYEAPAESNPVGPTTEDTK